MIPFIVSGYRQHHMGRLLATLQPILCSWGGVAGTLIILGRGVLTQDRVPESRGASLYNMSPPLEHHSFMNERCWSTTGNIAC